MFIMFAKYRTSPSASVRITSIGVITDFSYMPESFTWVEKSLPLPEGITEKDAVRFAPDYMMPLTVSYTVPSPP